MSILVCEEERRSFETEDMTLCIEDTETAWNAEADLDVSSARETR